MATNRGTGHRGWQPPSMRRTDVVFDPPKATIFPEPRTFFWLPIDGQRHAAGIRDRYLPYGEQVGTFCGKQLRRAPVDDIEWLWPTCSTCWSITAARVGLRA
ncbi:MAG: zinc finger protein [Pseudonocardiaceae bacterium]